MHFFDRLSDCAGGELPIGLGMDTVLSYVVDNLLNHVVTLKLPLFFAQLHLAFLQNLD